MSKTGTKALKELRRRLDRAYDRGTTGVTLSTALVRALVTDASAAESYGGLAWVEPYMLDKLRRVADRLYTEKRMNADDMRDAAHEIMAVVDGAIVESDDPAKGAKKNLR